MTNVDLSDVIKKILYGTLPNISDVGLREVDDYTESGIQDYLRDLKSDDKVKLARIQLSMAIIKMANDGKSNENDDDTYKCIVCESPVNNHGACKSNITDMYMGYGSKYDNNVVSITVCDNCLATKKEKGIIQISE